MNHAILSASLHDQDPEWAMSVCVKHLQSARLACQWAAITGLRHIARIHRLKSLMRTLPTLQELRANQELRGNVDDTLDDFEIYLGVNCRAS